MKKWENENDGRKGVSGRKGESVHNGGDGFKLLSENGSSLEKNGRSGKVNNLPPGPAQNVTSALQNTASRNAVTDFDSLCVVEASKETVKDLIIDWNKRVLARKSFRESNTTDVQYEEFKKLISDKKLDSSFKKCTAFVRKMRQFSEPLKATIESDINSLNLTKYISEIASVIVALRFKPNNVPSVLSICSELHKRYADFAEHLLNNFEKAELPNELTPTELSKVTTDLRLLGELLVGGVIPKEKGCRVLFTYIQGVVSLDADGTQLISPFTTLLHGLTEELLGIIPKDVRAHLQENASQLSRCDYISKQDKNKFKGLLRKYFGLVKITLIKKNDVILGSEKYNRKLRVTRGEVPPERQQSHNELVNCFEKYRNSGAKMANLLDLSVPKLRQLPRDPEDEFERALLMSDTGELLTEVPGIVLFEDEETRQFYQDLPDLKIYLKIRKTSTKSTDSTSDFKEVAGADDKCYEDESTSETTMESISTSEEDSFSDEDESFSDNEDEFDPNAERAELEQNNEEISPELDGDILPSLRATADCNTDDTYQEDIPNPVRQNFSTYLENLRNCVNKSMIDQAAYDFVGNFKNKRCRKELVRHLFFVPRQRVDLIHLYSRLVAALCAVHPEIGTEICDMLRNDFRYLVLKRDQTRVEPKLKVTRYIAELTNFSVFPKSEAFNCLKMLLRNFVHHQVEMACSLIEVCGRFLYRSYDSHRRMKLYMEEMMRRKSAKCLESRYAYMVDSAYHQICAPPGSGVRKKIKPPMQAFMEYVLCDDLSKLTLERAVKVLRMHDWSTLEKSELVATILSSPWKYSYVQLDTLAALLASLKQFRPSVTQAIIENISEGVRMGCEYECEDINNIRMSTCQFFANLYNYGVISTTTILNLFYYLISYGVTYYNTEFTRMDPPDSLYRVRLICNMLRISGDYFTSAKSRNRLDFFLKYFQWYYVYKRNLPIWKKMRFPHYVEEFYEDTVKIFRKNWKLVKTVEEAEREIMELDEKLRGKVKSDILKHALGNEGKSVRILVEKVPCDKLKAPTFAEIADVDNKSKESKPKFTDGNEAEEDIHGSRGLQKSRSRNCDNERVDTQETRNVLEAVEEEDDFEEAFESMCSESVSNPTGFVISTRPKSADIPAAKVYNGQSGVCALSHGLSKVKVTILTKENNKPKVKTVEIQQEADFLKNIKEREEAERLEKLEVKSKTLELTRIQNEEEQVDKQRELKAVCGNLLYLPKRK